MTTVTTSSSEVGQGGWLSLFAEGNATSLCVIMLLLLLLDTEIGLIFSVSSVGLVFSMVSGE